MGQRDLATAYDFTHDLVDRLKNSVQITTDGLKVYLEAIESAFGEDVQAVGSGGSGRVTGSCRVQKSGIAEQGMDFKTYFQLFWVPAIASAALMALLWAQDQ